jgi:uncharacterized protein YndB with AHSA1/START domain
MQTQGTLPEIRKTVVLNAPIEKVWKAVSTSEGIAAWWTTSTFEPVLGCEFMIQIIGWSDFPCKVMELDPPNRVGFDWGKDWYLAFELKNLDGKTEFTLIHSGWDPEKVTENGNPHSTFHAIMDSGWDKYVYGKLPSIIEA